ncbi:MAG: HAMP domain-containing sensor histidine kinase [Pseudomonadota bacterium]
MSIRKSLTLTLLGITLTMVIGYTWLMEANLVFGVLFGAEIRLHRAADAWIEAPASSTRAPVSAATDGIEMLPPDGTPVIYTQRSALPAAVLKHLSETPEDGQLTRITTDEVGLLNVGYVLHLYRALPDGEGVHVVQRLMLAEDEVARVQRLDKTMYWRALVPAAAFLLTTILFVWLFGRRVAKATTRLLNWYDGLSMASLPEKPPELPFTEMRRIAAGTLATVQREHDAIEHRHRFLRFASHELRTPLAIATANTELLARYGVDANAAPALARLEESMKNMNHLTDALLWLGRGEVPLPDPEPVDVLALVNGIADDHRAVAEGNNTTVKVVAAPAEPVVQSRVLLTILCSNLLGNAIRYTRDGRVEVRLTAQTIEIENRGSLLGSAEGASGHGLGLQLVEWVVERAGWRWEEEGDESYRRHRVFLSGHGD